MYEIASIENNGQRINTYVSKRDGATMYVFAVKLKDGSIAEVSRKSDTPPDIGAQYKTLTPSQGDYPPKLSGPVTDYKGGSKDFHADPKKLRSENARSALHAAKDLLIADKIALEDFRAWTDKMYEFVEAKAGVDR